MKPLFYTVGLIACSFSALAQVGIGTGTPKAFLNVPAGKTVLFGEDTLGAGTKLIWYANKGAFRAGSISGPQWNDANVGINSFSVGKNTLAIGSSSVAIGENASASGTQSFAIGFSAIAGNDNAVAIGTGSSVAGMGSIAIGNSQARGAYAVAIGLQNRVIANYSLALGSNARANKQGSCVIGDGAYLYEADSVYSTAMNQMTMRFSGGYHLFTSGGPQAQAVGVQILPGGNAWQTISDSTRKEHFRPVNGAAFLDKIRQLRLGSWNYKGQDSKQYRHYGPMAQDFFAAFGKDELGTIGEDKSINQADFDGVNLIAIQALLAKIERLETMNQALQQENAGLQQETASLKSDIDWIKKQLGGIVKK